MSEEHEVIGEDTPLTGAKENADTLDENTQSDTWYLLIISINSFIQAIPIGFFVGTVTLSLCENNISLSDLGKFSIVLLPYSFKVFLAPLVDSYYIEWIGKRKTYIIPCMFLAGITLIIFSSKVTDLIEQKDVWTLTAFGLTILGFYSILDVANDAWVLVIVHKRNFPIASSLQTLGGQMGFFIAFNILLPLASVEFLNAYFYSEPVTEPIITYGQFIFFAGIFTIVQSVVVAFCPERRSFADEIPITLMDIIKTFKQFVVNKNLLMIAIFLLTFYIPFEAVLAPFVPTIVQKGFKKTTIALLVTLMLPFSMLVTFAIGRIIKKYVHNIEIFFYCYMAAALALIFPVLVEHNFDSEQNYQSTSVYLFIFTLFIIICAICGFVAWNSFVLRITHESMASTFITCMNSINTFGRLWPHVTSLFVAQYFNSTVMYIFAVIFVAGYQYFMRKRLIPLQDYTHTDFGFYSKERIQEHQANSPPRLHDE